MGFIFAFYSLYSTTNAKALSDTCIKPLAKMGPFDSLRSEQNLQCCWNGSAIRVRWTIGSAEWMSEWYVGSVDENGLIFRVFKSTVSRWCGDRTCAYDVYIRSTRAKCIF